MTFARVWELVKGIVGRVWPRRFVPEPVTAGPVEVDPPAPVADPPVVLNAPASRRIRPRVDVEPTDTRWHFKGVILDRLDEYFTCIRQVRRLSPNAYELLKRTGLFLPADVYANPDAPAFNPFKLAEHHVTFGGILISDAYRVDKTWVWPSFVYFDKVRQPPGVAPFRGDVYHVTAIYDDRVEYRAAMQFHIGLAADGTAVLLKELRTHWEHIPVRHRTRRGQLRTAGMMPVKSTTWCVPKFLANVASKYDVPAERIAKDLFWLAFLTAHDTRARIVVRVKLRSVTAAFGIDLTRAKYFFADRDTTALAVDGKRKRIFHSVVAHDRVLDAERTVRVRRHYRGLRHFTWNAYEVGIVFPDVITPFDMNLPLLSAENIPDAELPRTLSMTEAGVAFDEMLSR